MKYFTLIFIFGLLNCKPSQMSTRNSSIGEVIITNHKEEKIKIKHSSKPLNKKHYSYKSYSKEEVPTDNTIKNKRDLKKANQSSKFKKREQEYLNEINKAPLKKKIFKGKFIFY